MFSRLRAAVAVLASTCAAAEPFHRAGLIFPLEHWHNHSSSVVELPNGDLLVCWYNGSGERTADDVKIEAARLKRGSKEWGRRYTLHDTPGFPDTNPALFVDKSERLWLLWPLIIANEWHTAVMRYQIATRYTSDPPEWSKSDVLVFKPVNFSARAKELLASWPEPHRSEMMKRADDKYFSRMGWMTRAHPVQLASGRMIVPLYSDGYDFSLMALSDDEGKTWTTSEPVVGEGAVQPSVVRRRDGTLVAYMRDNGPPPKRLLVSSSKDDGRTWTPAVDTEIPNSGSGAEAIVLRDGTWALVSNDVERGRHVLTIALSDDEGKTWKWKRALERDDRAEKPASFHYPSIIQARDGSLHVTYSYFLNHLPPDAPRKAIKHAHFNIEWVKAGVR